ncbi:MAG: hypothetical protein RJQ08_10775 [Salinisphaeraceae bacterium]
MFERIQPVAYEPPAEENTTYFPEGVDAELLVTDTVSLEPGIPHFVVRYFDCGYMLISLHGKTGNYVRSWMREYRATDLIREMNSIRVMLGNKLADWRSGQTDQVMQLDAVA